jgi:hypothetical protein
MEMATPTVTSWNSAFNECAAACNLNSAGLAALPTEGRLELRGHQWQRLGDRVQVAAGNAVWTVALADIKDVPAAAELAPAVAS